MMVKRRCTSREEGAVEKIGDVFCIQKLCLWPVAVLMFQFSRLCLVGMTHLVEELYEQGPMDTC